ncbi:MAG: HAMP domain-containing protein [Cyanosarcina radialis HA8281-LM2]|jgi:twitching motility protein PilJ|nr:HAMP domain-containing protein [Cyanosarcina radialis HA8281-LM2]
MIDSTKPNRSTSIDEFITPSKLDRVKDSGNLNPLEVGEEREAGNWWQRLSLRTKAVALAITLGIVPVVGIGTVAYYFANQQLVQEIKQERRYRTQLISNILASFLSERYADISLMASLPIFSNSNLAAGATAKEKQTVLDNYLKYYGYYDNIAIGDLTGKTILQSEGEPVTGLGQRDYFKQVIGTKRPTIVARASALTKKHSIFAAAPIVDSNTGKISAIVRSRIPVELLRPTLKQAAENSEIFLIDSNNKIILSASGKKEGQNANSLLTNFARLKANQSDATFALTENQEQLVAYTRLAKVGAMPDLKWSVVLTEPTKQAFAAQRSLLLTFVLGTALAALSVGAIAAYLTNRVIRPVVQASEAVEKLGSGQLATRVDLTGQDELGKLGTNINRLAEQIQNLLVEQEETTRQQITSQAEAMEQQAKTAQEQQLARELLQKRALELLMEVDAVSRGDLTIRASVTEDEIGTIADSYNATIGSLRKIVAQVQVAAEKMAATTSTNAVSVEDLSTEALRQNEEIQDVLNQIQVMSQSIREVASNAEKAEAAAKEATETVTAGDAAMNRTVDGILTIQETVSETAKKVRQLGEASQSISKVVKLIGTFAAQTNLLALKASIEAARAGEEGRGFAVLADEVRTLAQQSAQATSEIETLVANIQTETQEVVAAMEAGSQQVATGTKLVDETRQNLTKITAVSRQISELVEAIAQATVAQSQTSESVTQTMTDVAAIADRTSNEASQVSSSFKELLAVAEELQTSAKQFKVS